jgi:hypothetical protein
MAAASSEAAGSSSLRAVRALSLSVTVLSVAALCAFGLSGANPVTTHTTVTRHTVVTKRVAVAAPKDGAQSTASAGDAAAPALVGAGPLVASAPVTAPTTTVTPAAVTAPATTSAPAAPSAPVTDSGGTTATPSDLPACPLPLDSPAQTGGLQSLIPFAPFFGPFSSEAFAAAPLFQPLLEDVGPFLIAFANAYQAQAPALAPLVSAIESLENEGYNALEPLYGPYRDKFLAAESALATALAPLAKTVALNAGTSCLVDVEAELTAAAPS